MNFVPDVLTRAVANGVKAIVLWLWSCTYFDKSGFILKQTNYVQQFLLSNKLTFRGSIQPFRSATFQRCKVNDKAVLKAPKHCRTTAAGRGSYHVFKRCRCRDYQIHRYCSRVFGLRRSAGRSHSIVFYSYRKECSRNSDVPQQLMIVSSV